MSSQNFGRTVTNNIWRKDLSQKFIPAGKKTAPIAGFEDYFVRVVEDKNEIRDIDPIILIMVAREIAHKLGLVFTGQEEHHFQQLFNAMFKSVRQSTLQMIICEEKEKIEEKVKKLYSALLKVDSKDFKSNEPEKKYPGQFKYYEKKFERRNVIQNWSWNYKDLDVDAGEFIHYNEKAKLNITDYANTKWKGKKCIRCQLPCCKESNSACSYCSFLEKIKVFESVSLFFKMMGDMYTFYYYLPYDTLDFYLKNKKFSEMLVGEIPFNCIRLYALFWKTVKENKKEIDENVKRMKIERPFLLQKKRVIPNKIIDELYGVKKEEKKDDDIDAINGKTLE